MKVFQNPEQLTKLLASLKISDREKLDLNRNIANHARRYFRAQIRQQTDIYDQPYAPRKRTGRSRKRGMFTGLSRMLKTNISPYGFEVGLTGIFAHIGRIHNEGQAVSIPIKMNGYRNLKTNRFEGGTKSRMAVRMPERTFIGWNKQLEQEVVGIIMQAMESKL